MEKWFRSLFERETALYRDVVVRAGTQLGQFRELSELCTFLESQIMSGLPLRRVKIILISEKDEDRDGLMDRVQNRLAAADDLPLEDDEDLQAAGFDIAYALRREQRCTGALLIEAAPAL
jgi:hypothetical protein